MKTDKIVSPRLQSLFFAFKTRKPARCCQDSKEGLRMRTTSPNLARAQPHGK